MRHGRKMAYRQPSTSGREHRAQSGWRTTRHSPWNWLARSYFPVVASSDARRSFPSLLSPMSDRREFLKKTGLAAGAIAASGALRKAEAAASTLMAPPASPASSVAAPMDAATRELLM